MVDGRRVEVDVRQQPLLVLHHVVDARAHLEQLRAADLARELAAHLAQDPCARVAFLVDAVPEAHDLGLGGERLVEPGLDPLQRADLEQHAHHLLVRAAVQRALERPDRGHHARVEPRERARGDARREGRGVELVVRVQDQAGVELLDALRIGLAAEQHVEEVPRDRAIRDRLQRPLAAAHPVVGRDDRAEPRGQAHRLALVRRVVDHVGVGIVQRQARHHRVQEVHRVHLGRQPVEPGEGLGRQRHVAVQRALEGLELGARGKPFRARAGRRPPRRSHAPPDPRSCSRGRGASMPEMVLIAVVHATTFSSPRSIAPANSPAASVIGDPPPGRRSPPAPGDRRSPLRRRAHRPYPRARALPMGEFRHTHIFPAAVATLRKRSIPVAAQRVARRRGPARRVRVSGSAALRAAARRSRDPVERLLFEPADTTPAVIVALALWLALAPSRALARLCRAGAGPLALTARAARRSGPRSWCGRGSPGPTTCSR